MESTYSRVTLGLYVKTLYKIVSNLGITRLQPSLVSHYKHRFEALIAEIESKGVMASDN